MPIHDWLKVDAGLFHHFHHSWTAVLCNLLNESLLPRGFYAMLERSCEKRMVESFAKELSDEQEAEIYARIADHVAVYHPKRQLVAAIEIVCPGNRVSQASFREVVEKSTALIRRHINLLIVDVFARSRHGVHWSIWDKLERGNEISGSPKPLTLASYEAGGPNAFVDFVDVGDPMPEMPLFLHQDRYVSVPLEQCYETAWKSFPAPLKGLLESPGAQ